MAISDSIESRFSDLRASPVFENSIDLLKTKVWPEENFGDVKLQILVDLINPEWQVLKSFMVPLIENNKILPYLDIWNECLTTATLNQNVKMCYTCSKYYLSCHSQMLIWKECFREC